MQCSSCGFENPQGMKFCGQCAAQLAPKCPSCGFESPPQFKFCGQCGGPLGQPSQPPVAPPINPDPPATPAGAAAEGFPAAQAFLSSLAPTDAPPESLDEAALKTAKEWSVKSISSVSEALAIAVTEGTPGLQGVASSFIANQIRQKVEWTFSEPEEQPDGTHQVLATGTAPLEVGVLTFKWRSTAAATFELSIDAAQGKVLKWQRVPESFQLLSPEESDTLREQVDSGIEKTKERIQNFFKF